MTLRGQIFPSLLLLTPFTKGSLRKNMTLGSYGCWVKREPLTVMTMEPPHISMLQNHFFSSICSIHELLPVHHWLWLAASVPPRPSPGLSEQPTRSSTNVRTSLVQVLRCAKPPNTTKILPWAEPRAHLVASERFSFHRVSSCGGPSTMGTERYSSLG